MLEPQYHVAPQLLGSGDKHFNPNSVLMLDADLRKAVRVEQIKLVLQDLSCIPEKLFVVQNHIHHMVAQACALGATAVVWHPREIRTKLAQIEIAERAAPEISDLVRLLTVADIFAALVEVRPYWPAMSGQNAYKILCGMDGKLEQSLVNAFRNVALVT